jgi:UDP:flavonoid glycosyltransferase YjiC (YdhE family)
VGPPLAEKLGVPCFALSTYPLPHCRTRFFPNPLAEPLSPRLEAATRWPLLRRWAHVQTWRIEEQVWRGIFEDEVVAWRRDVLGLTGPPAVDEAQLRDRVPHLLGYSSSVLPVPSDWPSTLHVTGYWFHDLATSWQPPETLAGFLESGPRPVVIGFGSMVAVDDRETTAIVRKAVRRAGVRAILLSGWGGLDGDAHGETEERDVLAIKDAPHDWLFPRAAGVVHHGGSGTTGAGLRAGVPAFIVPFGYDQFLWGRRLHALGVGPRPVPHSRLTAGELASALRQLVSDSAMAGRARALGERIRGEDGLRAAVDVFEAHMGAV